MSRTSIEIIHCDNCGETTNPEDAYAGRGCWFAVAHYQSGGPDYDYCSGKCLFEHAGVQMPGQSEGTP